MSPTQLHILRKKLHVSDLIRHHQATYRETATQIEYTLELILIRIF